MDERVVVVTGSGAGLGEGIALRLGARGYLVVSTDIDEAAALATADAIESAGGRAIGHRLDVSDPDEVGGVARWVEAELGPAYGLVNNAGIGRATAFLDLTIEDWERINAVNCTGTLLMCQAFLRQMTAVGRGAIVNMSSIAGKEGFPQWVHYAVTKHAVIGLTRGLAREFGRAGVRVNALCPGAIKTAIWGAEYQGTDDPDAFFDALAERTALGRGQSVEDIAAAVEFLLGEEARNITGISLSVDSGLIFA